MNEYVELIFWLNVFCSIIMLRADVYDLSPDCFVARRPVPQQAALSEREMGNNSRNQNQAVNKTRWISDHPHARRKSRFLTRGELSGLSSPLSPLKRRHRPDPESEMDPGQKFHGQDTAARMSPNHLAIIQASFV